MHSPLDPSDPKNHPSFGSYLKYCRKTLDEIKRMNDAKKEELENRQKVKRLTDALRRDLMEFARKQREDNNNK